jgi:hypothetical protein
MNAILSVAAEPAVAAACAMPASQANCTPDGRVNWFRVQVYAAGILGCLTFWCGVIWMVSEVWP